MSKLFKLKEWVTVPDAAHHLAIAFGEPVSGADVLRLALDGRLTLSVDFVNHCTGRPGSIAYYTEDELNAKIASGEKPAEVKWVHISNEGLEALRLAGGRVVIDRDVSNGLLIPASRRIDANRLLTLTDEIVTLCGVFDLPMIGSERLYVEHYFQWLTGGPAVTLHDMGGALVQDSSGRFYNLMESWEDNEFVSGSRAELALIDRRIEEEKLPHNEATKLREAHGISRATFKEKQRTKSEVENFYPARGLPENAVLVVRTNALSKFLDSVSGRAEEKSVGTRERNSYLCVIAALCSEVNIDYLKPSKAAGNIRAIAHEKLGVDIGDTTIENYLKAIPDALESRKK
jgi:hypothetical protein